MRVKPSFSFLGGNGVILWPVRTSEGQTLRALEAGAAGRGGVDSCRRKSPRSGKNGPLAGKKGSGESDEKSSGARAYSVEKYWGLPKGRGKKANTPVKSEPKIGQGV